MKLFIPLLCTLCLFASCKKDRETDKTPPTEGKQVEFRFNVPVSSRAKVVDNAINELDVLVFRRQAAYAADPQRSTFLYTRYAWRVSDGRWRTNLMPGEGLDLYFAVNSHALVQGLAPSVVGREYRDVAPMLVLSTPGPDIGTGGLPMWGGIADKAILDIPNNDLGTVELLRSVASTDIRITASDFTLQQAVLCYAADRGLLPFASLSSQTPNVPGNMTSASTADWTYTLGAGDGNKVEDIFYMYENDAPFAGGNPQRRSTRLVLKGVWNNADGSGMPTWYPIALRSEDAGGEMVKSQVVRNNKYIVVITKVNGDGFPSFEEAKDAEGVNIDYEIIDWNQNTDGGIIIDGAQYIWIEHDRNERRDDRTAVVYRAAGSDDRVGFTTNIPLTDFTLSLNGGVYPDPSDKTAVMNSRFNVEIKTENGKNYFNFTALAAYGTSLNPSTLTVVAGRIRFTLTVIQKDSDSRDWNDGGNFNGDF